ncbi:hypothetical protein [Moritella viscosa]|jgi:hypothetical protein|uniref:Hypothetical bacteriophage protein n=1 Tax=Moritella viscosa TaxID=80854 RepID=A0A1L0B2E4_9GAMM|nr:hypothetical protein [Moritella viscosa]SGY96038.1 Hypothetical bacteriophage protein [Moritella viscosa]
MMYFAIEVCPGGGTIRDVDTFEPRTVEIGDHESKDDAVENACQMLDCRQLFRGVIGRLKGHGGYVVLNAQDHAEV